MRYLFLLNPTAGKRDCTAELARPSRPQPSGRASRRKNGRSL